MHVLLYVYIRCKSVIQEGKTGIAYRQEWNHKADASSDIMCMAIRRVTWQNNNMHHNAL